MGEMGVYIVIMARSFVNGFWKVFAKFLQICLIKQISWWTTIAKADPNVYTCQF
jgi:hypothetical protein